MKSPLNDLKLVPGNKGKPEWTKHVNQLYKTTKSEVVKTDRDTLLVFFSTCNMWNHVAATKDGNTVSVAKAVLPPQVPPAALATEQGIVFV